MENPLRTAAYVAKVADRQTELRSTSAAVLAGLDAFVLEIGCGHGHFLTAYAAAHPSKVCVGLDIISDRIDRAERKKHRAGLKNLHFLHASAGDFLSTMPESARFSAVFALFPDPWPKRRHHKNRLVQPEFLSQVARRAAPEMRFCFRTDDADYFKAAQAEVLGHPQWALATEPWPFEYETVFQQRASGFHSLIARVEPG